MTLISIDNSNRIPAGKMIPSDALLEPHAARLLLLINYCGMKDQKRHKPRLDGLTKLAKLDFFVRYPRFLNAALKKANRKIQELKGPVESPMIRYYYGPWDNRYYQVLPYLEARGLIEILKNPKYNRYEFHVTEKGEVVANKLAHMGGHSRLIDRLRVIKEVFSKWSGSALKSFIYETFSEEVGNQQLEEVIEQ